MSQVKNSHAKKLYEDAFMLLTAKIVKWPEFFTCDMKRTLVQHHLDYWESQEEFIKCISLRNKLKDINENRLGNKRN